MKRRYDTLSMVEKQRLLDDFNMIHKRTIRSVPSDLFSSLPPPPPQPPGAGASAAAVSSAYRVPEAPERVEPQIPAGPPTPDIEQTYDALGPDMFRAPPRSYLLSPRSDLVLPSTAPTSQVPIRDMVAERSLYMAQQQIGGQTYPPPYPAPPPHEEEQPAPVIRPHFERRTSGEHGYAPVLAEEVEREETPPSSRQSSTSSSETGTEASPKAPPPQRTRASASTSSAAVAASSASAAAPASSAPARTGSKTRAAVVDISEVAPAPSGTAKGKGNPRAKSKRKKKQELVGSSAPQTSSNRLPYRDTNNDPYFIEL